MDSLIKSKKRVRDNGEVFTPDFIVQGMLDLVKNESENIESTFLEPACGNGNFLIEILRRKMDIIMMKYRKNQLEFECRSLLAIGGIYGVDLMEDNVKEARDRLNDLVLNYYKQCFKKKEHHKEFLLSLNYILERNLIQGNALTYTKEDGKPIIFSSRKLWQNKIRREDFSFEDLAENETSLNKTYKKNDRGEDVFRINEIHKYEPIFYLKLYTQDDYKQDSIQSGCIRCISESKQGGSLHSAKNSKGNVRSFAQGNMVGLFN